MSAKDETKWKMKPLSSQIIKAAIKKHKLKRDRVISLAQAYALDPSNSTFKDFDRKKIDNSKLITRTSYDKFKKGEGYIRQDICKAFCHVLHLDEPQIVMLTDPIIKNGQREIPVSSSIFNDYEGHRCLDEIWVDPLPMELGHGGIEYGYMNVHVKKDESILYGKYISLIFKRQGWGCNVTLRPAGESSILTDKFNFLKFELRSPEEKSHTHHIGVRIRLTDAKNIIWCYGNKNKQKLLSDTINNYIELGIYCRENLSVISNNKWKPILIPLEKQNWFNFIYDGETPKEEFPDFNEIKLITFDVGFEDSNENDEKCQFSGFSKQDIREGKLHISKINFI